MEHIVPRGSWIDTRDVTNHKKRQNARRGEKRELGFAIYCGSRDVKSKCPQRHLPFNPTAKRGTHFRAKPQIATPIPSSRVLAFWRFKSGSRKRTGITPFFEVRCWIGSAHSSRAIHGADQLSESVSECASRKPTKK